MPTNLDEILTVTRREVEHRMQTADLATLELRAEAHVPRGFVRQLRRYTESAPAVIAELKKASPSRGLIRADFDAAALAAGMADAGAAALSILTEGHFFQGSLDNLASASAATRLPCLRKDFIVDEFQILESRAYCADAILLIAAALDDATLCRITDAAHTAGLDVLCEVHDLSEIARIRDLDCDAIGVNNRNLHTFEVTLENALKMAESLPAGPLHIAESGIRDAKDIARLRASGYEAFLIGESLMREKSPGDALSALLSGDRAPREISA